MAADELCCAARVRRAKAEDKSWLWVAVAKRETAKSTHDTSVLLNNCKIVLENMWKRWRGVWCGEQACHGLGEDVCGWIIIIDTPLLQHRLRVGGYRLSPAVPL